MTTAAHRRTHTRYPVRLPVRVSTEMLDLEAEVEVGEVSDVSERGLFVRSDFLEPAGTAVQMVITSMDGQPVSLSGHVVWVAEQPPRGPGMGIELDEGSQQRSVVERLAGAA